MGLSDGDDEHRRSGRQHGSEGEHGSIDAIDGDAEGLGHFLVILGCAHDQAEPAAGERGPGGEQQRDRGGDDDQLVARIAEPRELYAPVDRRLDGTRVRSVEAQGQLLEDVEEADGGKNRRFRLVVQPLENQPLREQSQCADNQRAQEDGDEEADGRDSGGEAGEPPCEHRAQHEELAMGNVDDTHDTEDQRQAQGCQRQDRGHDGAFEEGKKEIRAEAQLTDSPPCHGPPRT